MFYRKIISHADLPNWQNSNYKKSVCALLGIWIMSRCMLDARNVLVRLSKAFFILLGTDVKTKLCMQNCQFYNAFFTELLQIYRQISQFLPIKISLPNPLWNWALIGIDTALLCTYHATRRMKPSKLGLAGGQSAPSSSTYLSFPTSIKIGVHCREMSGDSAWSLLLFVNIQQPFRSGTFGGLGWSHTWAYFWSRNSNFRATMKPPALTKKV